MIKSKSLFSRAKQSIPGGVNSPVRAFNGVGGDPLFFERGEGAYLIDVDGQRYIDFVGSWGPLILGHAHPKVVEAVHAAVAKGLSFGAPTELEVLLAEQVTRLMPSMEMVRFVSSGTEATMSAIRVARGVTDRDKIIKFEGCYHGHNDALLVKAGSGALTLGIPGSKGVPADFVQHTLTASFNDLGQVEQAFAKYPHDIAAVIVEPIAANMNCILPVPGFLQGLRALCDRYGSLLIFDEVITGFRVGLGGAQALYGVAPDLTTLGKIVGGGMPVGAFGGKKRWMQHVAPLGQVYQAGTLSGNPVAMAAGLATLNEISQPGFYEKLAEHTSTFVAQLRACAKKQGVPLVIPKEGSMFGLFFTDREKITSFEEVKACNVDRYKKFFHGMLKAGVYFAPSAFEVGFLSSAHGPKEITQTLAAADRVLAELA